MIEALIVVGLAAAMFTFGRIDRELNEDERRG